MTTFQKIVKYLAIALALFLIAGILEAVFSFVGLIGGLFDRDDTVGETQTYEISDDIDRLKIEIGAADFKIEYADAYAVESNLKRLTVKEQNGTLIIRQRENLGITEQNTMLTLYLPEEKIFKHVELTTGAGRLTVEKLSAETLIWVLGAGEVSVSELNALLAADISGGAGRISIHGGALRNLDLEMGVGELNLTSALTGDCELELGIGQSNIQVLGNREDYRLDLEKGLGELTVNGVSLSNTENYGNGQHKLSIHGGIGAIHVDFAPSAD